MTDFGALEIMFEVLLFSDISALRSMKYPTTTLRALNDA